MLPKPQGLLPQGRVVGKKSLTMLNSQSKKQGHQHTSDIFLILFLFFFLQEGTNEEPVTVLLGNKSDLPEEDGSKVVKYKDGTRLADVSLNLS